MSDATVDLQNITTPNLGLNKPLVGGDEDIWGGLLNANCDVLDSQITALRTEVNSLSGQLLFIGTYDVVADHAEFSAASAFPDGPLPPASPANYNSYLVTTTAGTGIGNAPHVALNQRDWLVSDGVEWVHLALGSPPAGAIPASTVTVTPAVQGQTDVQSALQQLDQLQQGYFPLTGGVLTGWARTTNGTAAAPALQIGAADAGFWKLGATMFLGAGGVAVMQYSATAVTAQVPMTLPADPISNLQAATKQYVDNKVSVTTPTMNGTAAVGTFTTLARADHVHPSDTSKYAASNPSNYQTGAQVTASLGAYYTAATSDGRYVYKSGDTITGGLNVNGTVNVGGQVDATGSFNSVNGYICQAGISAAKGSSVFNIFWNGTPHLYIDASYMGQFTFVSDYRIKRDVVPLGAMWEAIKALRPVSYKHKDYTPPNETRAADDPFIPADDVERWGFIAHELQETLTANAATGEKDQANCIQSPNPWTVLAAVTRALQEAMARIEVLEGLVTK